MAQGGIQHPKEPSDDTPHLIASIVLLLSNVASWSHAQDWQFTRDGAADQVGVALFAGAVAGDAIDNDGANIRNDVFVGLGASASASDSVPPGSASVDNVGVASAQNLTPSTGTTLLPTVDTTVSQTQALIAEGGKRASTLENTAAIADAAGNFQLTGSVATGFLRGSIYLVGIQSLNTSGDGQIGGALSVAATVNGFGANADYDDDTGLWTVDVFLPNFTTTFTAAGVNQFYTFLVPITLPTAVNVMAISESEVTGNAGLAGGGSAQAEINLSASAWAQFTPTEAPPPGGDFDGDLDVDGEDFLAWQRGVGEINGATLAQGDANHDGMVDGIDLDVWQSNFGTGSMSPVVNVPEPMAHALLFTMTGIMVGSRLLRLVN